MILHPSKHLTSNYEKDIGSNIYSLLDLSHTEHMEILRNLNNIEAFRDMDNAPGFTLDKIGKNVLELRNGRNDEAFRRAIKIKIRGNLSAGTIEDINVISEILFGENYLSVRETWCEDGFDFEPAAILISISDNPDAQAMFLEYIKNITMAVKASGVRLYNKIMSEIPTASLYAGGFVAGDSSRIDVPMRMLADLNCTGRIYAGGCLAVDSIRIDIPARTLADTVLTGGIDTGVGVYDTGYMTVPTADLREVV